MTDDVAGGDHVGHHVGALRNQQGCVMHSAGNGACPASVTYTPVDGETGNPLPEHTARCVSPAGHIGLHVGDDRMPFGPPVKRPIPPGRSNDGTPQ